ncbi:MAG: FAD/NAD(P)-binding protein [Planctomycetota bacterium]
MSLEWLIVGGGIHGVHLATRLIEQGDFSADELAIVDPGDRLLERWRCNTGVTGMTHLRSPGVHHLDLAPFSLLQFAKDPSRGGDGELAEPYSRPSLSLFNTHCDRVIAKFGLAAVHHQDRVVSCLPDKQRVLVRLAKGGWVEARNVIFAIGMSEQPYWPDGVPQGDARVQHVFAAGFGGWPTTSDERVAVLGGGISAAQVALRLSREGHRVRLVTRHAFREHRFDSDPGWLGPRLIADFDRHKKTSRRREIITKARHRGSVPPDVIRPLRRALEQDEIIWEQQDVEEVIPASDVVYVRYSNGLVVEADRVLLATGFTPNRPGGAMLDSLVESASLPCADCGFPIVDETLRWHRRIYVTGPLAELEIGPISRNIAGARVSADRIVSTVKRRDRKRRIRLADSAVAS